MIINKLLILIYNKLKLIIDIIKFNNANINKG